MTKDTHERALEAAYEKARAAVKEKPTNANLKALETAGRLLKEYLAGVETDPKKQSFKNIGEVLNYLQGAGWKIKKSKLHADANKIGKQTAGAFLKKDVDTYAKLRLSKVAGDDDESDASRSRDKVEIELLEEKLKEQKFKNEVEARKWVRRDKVEPMLASRSALLMDSVGPSFIHSKAAEIIEIVKGDQGFAPELIAFWLKEIEEFFHQYSRPVEFAAPLGAEYRGEDIE